jgi:hypothetical protein
MNGELRNLPLPNGIRSRVVDNHNALSMHVLEAGYETLDVHVSSCRTVSQRLRSAGAK